MMRLAGQAQRRRSRLTSNVRRCMNLPEFLSSLLLGTSLAACAGLAAACFGGADRLPPRIAAALGAGLPSTTLLLSQQVSISLPYVLVLGCFAAVGALPLVTAHTVLRDRHASVSGLMGSLLSVGLLVLILFQTGRSLSSRYSLLAWFIAAAAGYTTGSLYECVFRVVMRLRMLPKSHASSSA
jgi:hypothetical protein